MNIKASAPLRSQPSRQPTDHTRVILPVATKAARECIYRLRHEVYARELRQHIVNSSGSLRDPLDDSNVYLMAEIAGEIVGFISITPPGGPGYSIDKYLSRDSLPFLF